MNTTSDASPKTKCQYCGQIGFFNQPPHPGVCPSIKAIEYFPDGNVKRVEFHNPPAPFSTVTDAYNWQWWWDDDIISGC